MNTVIFSLACIGQCFIKRYRMIMFLTAFRSRLITRPHFAFTHSHVSSRKLLRTTLGAGTWRIRLQTVDVQEARDASGLLLHSHAQLVRAPSKHCSHRRLTHSRPRVLRVVVQVRTPGSLAMMQHAITGGRPFGRNIHNQICLWCMPCRWSFWCSRPAFSTAARPFFAPCLIWRDRWFCALPEHLRWLH